MNHEYKKRLAAFIIIFIGVVLLYGLLPYLSAFFGALILFVIFLPLYKYLTKHHVGEKKSAFIIIVVSSLVLVIPLSLIVGIAFNELGQLIDNREELLSYIDKVDRIWPGLHLLEKIKDQAPQLLETTRGLLLRLFKGTAHALVNLFIMYILLFYLLTNKDRLYKKTLRLIPFNDRNSYHLINEFKEITNSTLFTSGLIALIQGALVTIAFLIFGLSDAFLFGFVAFIASFLPVVGTALVWLPASLILLFQQNYIAGIGMLIFGLFISTIDNILRPFIQNKVRPIHPSIVLLGIFMGIPLFGILGVFIGPLLLSYFLLTTDMFMKEYIKPDKNRSRLREKIRID